MAMRNLKQLVTKICSVSAISCMSRECIAGPKCLQLKQKRSKKRVRYQKAVASNTQIAEVLQLSNTIVMHYLKEEQPTTTTWVAT